MLGRATCCVGNCVRIQRLIFDNAAFHKKDLAAILRKSHHLLFLPLSPDLNPIERDRQPQKRASLHRSTPLADIIKSYGNNCPMTIEDSQNR